MLSDFVNVRHGLSNVLERLKKEPCRIGYLGASVTAQKNGFRPLLHNWLCEFTNQPHTQANAALGANGSICSVFVMDELLLKHQPKLCFVECSVGDMAPYTPLSEVGPVMEGIIRKLKDNDCEICLLHLYRADRSYADNAVIAAQERVADYYNVPSINLGRYLEISAERGEIEPGKFLKDSIHTTEQGALYTADLLSGALKEIFSSKNLDEYPLSLTPLHSPNYSKTILSYCSSDMVGKNAKQKLFRFFYPYIEVGSNSDISFTPDAELISLLTVVGPESGTIMISAGSEVQECQLLDEWCTADRIRAVILEPFIPAKTKIRINV